MPSLFDDDDTSTTSNIDPDVIRTIIGEGDPAHVASVLANRKAKSGIDYSTLITDPTQFEARTGDAWNQNSKISTDDPRYQKALAIAAPILSGTSKPVTDADSFYSPSSQTALGRSKPTWDDGTGVEGPDKQLYFSGKYNRSPSLFDDNENAKQESTKPAETSPTEATQLLLDANNADPDASWPIHDPYNHVFRNKDGSIESLGDPSSKPIVDKDGVITVNVNRGTSDFDPKNIQEWLKNHPDDIANQANPLSLETNPITGKPFEAAPAKGDLGSGFNQGVANVSNSIEGLAAPFSQDVRNDLTKSLIARQTNDISNQDNVSYGLGKFGGELAASTPVLAMPGVGELADGALATSKLAPALRFAGGTAGEGNALIRGASLATKGALQGGEASALTSAGSNQSLAQQVGTGALTGAIAAPVFHGIGSVVSNHLNPVVPPQISDLANKASKFGIDLDMPQIKGAVDDANFKSTNTSGRILKPQKQNSQILQAIGSTFKLDPAVAAKGLTSDVMSAAQKNIGTQMNNIRTGITLENNSLDNMFSNLDGVRSGINIDIPGTPGKDLRGVVANIARVAKAGGNKFTGNNYQSLTAKGSKLDSLLNSKDPTVAQYAGKIKSALDDAFSSISPQYRDLRMNYKNLMTVAKLTPNNAYNGIQLLQDLPGVVNRQFQGNAFKGAGELGDLADIGRTFYNTTPKTGPSLTFGPKSLISTAIGAAGETGLALTHPGLALKALAIPPTLYAGKILTKAAQNSSIKNQIAGKSITTPTANYLANRFSVPATTLAIKQAINKKEITN